MTYRAPVNEIMLSMAHNAGLDQAIKSGLYADMDTDSLRAILEEAGKFAADILAPLNQTGDSNPVKLGPNGVETAPGWRNAYAKFVEGGWSTVSGSPDHGGMGLPELVAAAITEMWNSANLAFGLCPLLSIGAIHALEAHGSQALQGQYLEKLISGQWTGTMNLTEPNAGSDLSPMRTKAERVGDGTYKITGQKIYITYGDHDMAENIVHLVLARLPDAPAGTRGISLFLVPKFMVNADGSLGERNDAFCASLEHKLGIHASPTCTMVFGDKGGATGYLIGEENKGLACMFTMMNSARLGVGIQGVALAERATQQALLYAADRRQGKALGDSAPISAIIHHPDVQRMLLTMQSQTRAARALCLMTAASIDIANLSSDATAKKQASERAGLLTPIAKAFSTDIANEVTSLNVQVHGGMGFIEGTGAAQHMRDARILAIYEGTNGIQAIDLVQRKLPLGGGEAIRQEIAHVRAIIAKIPHEPAFGHSAARLTAAVDAMQQATEFLTVAPPQAALAGATAYLRICGLALGGAALAAEATGENSSQNIRLCRFFAEHLSTAAPGLALSIISGADAVGEVA